MSERERAILRGVDSGFEGAFAAIESADKVVTGLGREIDREAERQIEELSRQVATERDRVKRYRAELLALNGEAEEVVGGVTFENFSNVKKRFHDLILKADVGIIDVAWMRKEEHKARGTSLTKDRLAEIQALDEEFNEVKSQAPASGGE